MIPSTEMEEIFLAFTFSLLCSVGVSTGKAF